MQMQMQRRIWMRMLRCLGGRLARAYQGCPEGKALLHCPKRSRGMRKGSNEYDCSPLSWLWALRPESSTKCERLGCCPRRKVEIREESFGPSFGPGGPCCSTLLAPSKETRRERIQRAKMPGTRLCVGLTQIGVGVNTVVVTSSSLCGASRVAMGLSLSSLEVVVSGRQWTKILSPNSCQRTSSSMLNAPVLCSCGAFCSSGGGRIGRTGRICFHQCTSCMLHAQIDPKERWKKVCECEAARRRRPLRGQQSSTHTCLFAHELGCTCPALRGLVLVQAGMTHDRVVT